MAHMDQVIICLSICKSEAVWMMKLMAFAPLIPELFYFAAFALFCFKPSMAE